MDETVYDVTIIGGGPVGLFAAFYGGLRQMKVKIIESMPQLGGQLAALYPEKYIYDVAGMPKVKAQSLVDRLIEQAMQFHPTIVLNETVQDVKKTGRGTFRIETGSGLHFSKTVLITAGIGACQPRRIEHEQALQYENKNLHYFVNDMRKFKGKEVCILGGGDSAVDWALMLEPVAKSVKIVHRRDQFRAHEQSVETMKRSSVEIFTPYLLKDLDGDGLKIKTVTIEKVNSGDQLTFQIDELLVHYGFISNLAAIKKIGLHFEKNAIVVDSAMRTNIEGIFAAGDVTTFDGKVKLIAQGFGEAATAIASAKVYLDPAARKQPQHSTSLFEKVKV